MPQYDQHQVVFCHSALSNLSASQKGSGSQIAAIIKPEIIKVLADSTVQSLIGSWELVWGPEVVSGPYKPGGDLAINTMYIARSNDNPSQFIVAIAGTDEGSKFDWLVEDFWVAETKPWPYLPAHFAGPTPVISNGTNFGLNRLLGMKDGTQHARDYLQQNAATVSGSTITVTGHSLGGALSPSYALYLLDTASEWNNAGNASIQCLATAGPTPGDNNFSQYYGGRLGSNTTRVWNAFDVVPHAWQADMLAQIPTLYAPTIEPNFQIEALVTLAKFVSRKTPYTQLLPNTLGAAGNVVQVPSQDTFTRFMMELCYQHIDAYVTIFGIQDFQSAVTSILLSGTGKTFMSCNITIPDIQSLAQLIQQETASMQVNVGADRTAAS